MITAAVQRRGSSMDGTERRPQLRRRLVVGSLQLAALVVSAAVIIGLLHQANPMAVIRQSGHADWPMLVLAIALNVPTTILRARRSQVLLRRLGRHVPGRRMIGVNLAGQTLSWLTPAAAGDFARPYLWRSHDGVPAGSGVAAVLYERLVTLLQMGIVGGVLTAAIYLPVPLAAGAGVMGAILMAAPWWVSRIVRRAFPDGVPSDRRGPAGAVLRTAGRLQDLGVSARVGVTFASLSVAVFLLSGLQILLLVNGVGASVPLGVAVAAFCVSQAAGSISALPFGAGAGDVVTIALLQAGGIGVVAATATDILVRLVVTLPLGLAGAAAILVLGRPRLHSEVGARPHRYEGVLTRDATTAPAVSGRAA